MFRCTAAVVAAGPVSFKGCTGTGEEIATGTIIIIIIVVVTHLHAVCVYIVHDPLVIKIKIKDRNIESKKIKTL
jgi:hypothetical protein